MSERTKPRPVYVSLGKRNYWKQFHTWAYWQFGQQPTCQAGDYLLFKRGKTILGRATITHLEKATLPPHTTWHLPERVVWKVYWDASTFVDYRPQLGLEIPPPVHAKGDA